MKIKEICSEHGNDFTAIMICEYCGNEEKNTSGYHDNFYHTKVIPGMYCKKCGKNRAGYNEIKRCRKDLRNFLKDVL